MCKVAVASKVPDCFQRTPRRINIPDNGNQILTLTIDGQGILFSNIFFLMLLILLHFKVCMQ